MPLFARVDNQQFRVIHSRRVIKQYIILQPYWCVFLFSVHNDKKKLDIRSIE